MKKKNKKEIKKIWEKPLVRTLPFKSILGGIERHSYKEDAFYS